MKITRIHVLSIAFVIVGVVVAGAWLLLRSLHGVENAYAVWNVADWVIDYMESHQGQWPRNWEDLQAVYEKRAGQDVSDRMSHYRELVEVDFDADPKAIAYIPFNAAVDEPPFKVIRHRRKPETHFEGAEPNRLIWSYLHGEYRSSTQPTTVPATAPSAR